MHLGHLKSCETVIHVYSQEGRGCNMVAHSISGKGSLNAVCMITYHASHFIIMDYTLQ